MPAEFETDVTRFVMQRMIAEALQAWTEEEVRQLCDGLEEPQMAMLVALSEIVMAGTVPDDRQVADRLGTTTEDVVHRAVALASACEAMSKVSIVMMDNGPDTVPADATDVTRTFTFSPRFARTVLIAAGRPPAPPTT